MGCSSGKFLNLHFCLKTSAQTKEKHNWYDVKTVSHRRVSERMGSTGTFYEITDSGGENEQRYVTVLQDGKEDVGLFSTTEISPIKVKPLGIYTKVKLKLNT